VGGSASLGDRDLDLGVGRGRDLLRQLELEETVLDLRLRFPRDHGLGKLERAIVTGAGALTLEVVLLRALGVVRILASDLDRRSEASDTARLPRSERSRQSRFTARSSVLAPPISRGRR
jgi:hypothetical protein